MHRTIAAIFSLCFLSISPLCRAFTVEDCGSTVGKFTAVNLDCDMSKSTCDLIQGTNATLALDFTIDKDVSKVIAVVHGIIMDVPIPFPLSSANACETAESGLQCPLSAGGPYHYKNTLPVLKTYPKLSVLVKWQLRNENNEVIVCMLIPARIR